MTGAAHAGGVADPPRALFSTPTDFVVDAGVAIKWYVPELHDAEAKRVLDPAFTLHVPELFYPEFGIVVWKKACVRKPPEITVDEGRDILDLLLGVSLSVHPTAPLLRFAYEIAVTLPRPTAYDCFYLALANALRCRLVTADQAFHNALKGSSHGPRLLWVADPI
jgi:predicted nucleic acid-binding protein